MARSMRSSSTATALRSSSTMPARASSHAAAWTGHQDTVTAASLDVESAIVDGEIIVTNEAGLSDYHALLSANRQPPARPLLRRVRSPAPQWPRLARHAVGGPPRGTRS